MKELKIFAIVVFLSGVLYWGIEPYAHTQLHPHTAAANFDYAQADDVYAKNVMAAKETALANAKATNDAQKIKVAQDELDSAKKYLEEYSAFWADIKNIDLSKGDATKGADTFMAAGCTGCHGVQVAGMPAGMDNETASQSFGVVPPDLSTAGVIYDDKFLAAFIKNPTMAAKLGHKFNDEKPYPMTAFMGAGGDDINKEIADIVAYLKSIATKYVSENKGISDAKLFEDACQRCHDMKYDNKYTLTNRVSLASYMGSNPPDLSMMIRAKNSDNYLAKLINDPQKMLSGTAMPRVGLSSESTNQIVSYIEKVGDSKKDERSNVGIYTMVYFLILGIFATLWKRKVWSELH
ncbi:c-type cytochrome [Campylobacter mucosalis]|uniref:Ubiquinol cytochrome c oxidoreductase PetABC, membrane-bound cytochrome c subunit n=1 Tax=Campylobacter mucosalis CCUG 21559 TaxID=1032067 RepID=A0A6G5QFB0_9BACT|nr:c-type cytochrome [Campylobacter mucosalis]QCD44375.1 ubiquinol cytochrome c oxidoreductase PetABC, membrane-bound cytochrome c subunit [Campylobacter mucosalis CCUG 21559]